MGTKQATGYPSLVDLIQFQEKCISANIWMCCLNCSYWGPNNIDGGPLPEGCTHYKAVPPPSVLVVGCPKWCSLIPF